MTRVQTHIAAMHPYALAEMEVQNGKSPISLSQNESLRPPSPKSLGAASNAIKNAALYPDPDWTQLRHALALQHGLDAKDILCGNGSLDLIGCIARAFSGQDRAVLAPRHAYPFFKTASLIANARYDTAPERNATVDVDALLNAVRADTGLVFIANPGNPTSTRIAKPELVRLRNEMREDILLVIDEAYGEFADHLDQNCFDMVRGGSTVALRTFSKAYGLAGLRVGWGLFPQDVAAEMRKVMNPSNVSAPAQAAALAAVSDQHYMRETCAMTATLRNSATVELRKLGFRVLPSFTNFILIDLDSAASAQSADAALRARGIFLRPQSGAGLPNALRMTIGPQDFVAQAISTLAAWKMEHEG